MADKVKVLYSGPADATNTEVGRETGLGDRLVVNGIYEVSTDLAEKLVRSEFWSYEGQPKQPQKPAEAERTPVPPPASAQGGEEQ